MNRAAAAASVGSKHGGCREGLEANLEGELEENLEETSAKPPCRGEAKTKTGQKPHSTLPVDCRVVVFPGSQFGRRPLHGPPDSYIRLAIGRVPGEFLREFRSSRRAKIVGLFGTMWPMSPCFGTEIGRGAKK